MGLFEQLQDLMIKYHFRPEKKLSQFFCTNEALIIFLANSANIQKNDVILEIGPGTGFLTRKLVDKAKKVGAKVVAVEADEMMCDLLNAEFASDIAAGLLEVMHASALDVDYEKLGVTKIVSLPPYHISSDLVTKVSLTKGLSRVILVLDRGFVQKLTAFEGLSEYVALSVLVNLNSKVEILEGNVAQQSFFPAPNCQSAVVQLDFNVKNNSQEFYSFLRELFRHKNKDLSRSLKQAYPFLENTLGWDEKKFIAKSKTLELAGQKVYSLTPQELFEVFEALKESSKPSKAKK